ncbi:MAG: tRNA threonylcarbamoyladenosine dehydratase [Coriobacteriales bacterium]|nr:tRNA threonylcarbamoyladenosine dehydratase [Coriobacteriales bacterium]
MSEAFSRTELLLGSDAMECLAASHVIVFGVGGVGGYAMEALARSGVGAIDVVDDDVVAVSNINRQILATTEALGRPKVEVAAERIASINPQCQVVAHRCFYLPQTADRFDLTQYDYVIDAVDTITAKLHIISSAKAAGTPVISSMGAANKLDPTAFRVADISKSSICPLARIIRKEARKRGLGHFKVVFSVEEPVIRQGLKSEKDDPHPRRSGTPGSVAFVPSVAGLILAGEVVRDLTGQREVSPLPGRKR